MPSGRRKKPESEKKINYKYPSQDDASLPKCLGWCGGKRFKPKFPNSRFCVPCTQRKDSAQRDMSPREQFCSNIGDPLG